MSENCTLCGQPMPRGEGMFKYHGYSGDCPKRWESAPPDPSPTPWDHSTWGFFCDHCMVFFDLVEDGNVTTFERDGEYYAERWHKVCGTEARYIGYDREAVQK